MSDLLDIMKYISANADKELTLKVITEGFGLSQSTVQRLFKNGLGLSMTQYLWGYRVELAGDIIVKQPNKPLKEVAAETGFLSQAHFSRKFKSVMKVGPREFAKLDSAGRAYRAERAAAERDAAYMNAEVNTTKH